MATENDIRREEARKRLEARMQARGSSGASGSERTRRPRERVESDIPLSRHRHEDEPAGNRRPSGRAGNRRPSRAQASKDRPSNASAQRNRRPHGRPRSAGTPRNDYRTPQRNAATAPVSLSRLIVGIVAILAILIIIVIGIRACASSDDLNTMTSATTQGATATTTQQTEDSDSAGRALISGEELARQAAEDGQAVRLLAFNPFAAMQLVLPKLSETEIDEDYIAIIIGADFADMLIEEAQTNADAFWIASHPDEYLEDGATVRYKLLKLAAKEPQAVSFVRDWPEKYCADGPDYGESHTDESSNGVPRFYQWDKRWGYTEYSSTTFALTACGPTTMAMVYQALTGDASIDPYTMAVWCIDHGYATAYDGTDSSFFIEGANELGLNSQSIGTDAYSITQALSSGKYVIANVGPGDFTEGGHYFVITGVNADGTVSINDPYSAVRSAQTWDPELIASQSKAIFAIG